MLQNLLGKKVQFNDHTELNSQYHFLHGTIIKICSNKRKIFNTPEILIRSDTENTYTVRFPDPDKISLRMTKTLKVTRNMFDIDEDQNNPDSDTINRHIEIITETITQYSHRF